ncbi:YtxH domain-containing protein [Ureibacillus aquaedulcis]|uniref:YtxH domain-containing protein n=1 Tax=Ureibacillus aquaedulcis TaxID=3058421 RepID=A0ABT8GP29_9BACL|nr:YtxH domain-containing protein [Ureibacillus sp. BA0131]MDN4493173.1 YtxH domain-containing protein [Ureibacillus sp. BA0131]
MRTKPFLIGLSAGVIGGLTALLFTAPQPGKQIRSNISRNSKIAKSYLGEVKHHSVSVKDSFTTIKSEVKNNIPEIINGLKHSFSRFSQDIEPETAKLKEEIDGLQKSIIEIENNLSDLNNKKKKEEEKE